MDAVTPSAVGGNAVEDGRTTSEFLAAKVAAVLAPFALPILNGLLAQIPLFHVSLTETQLTVAMAGIFTTAVGYILSRTLRKTSADAMAAKMQAFLGGADGAALGKAGIDTAWIMQELQKIRSLTPGAEQANEIAQLASKIVGAGK